MPQKIQKKFFVSEILASELLSLNCVFQEQDTCHGQPTCSEAVATFGMSIRETFSNSVVLKVINEFDKGAVMQIPTVLEHVYHVACRRVL